MATDRDMDTARQWNLPALPIVVPAISLMPFAIGMSGWIYLLCTVLLNAVFVFHAPKLDDEPPPRMFRHTIIYVALVLAALLLDHYLRLG